MKKIDTIKTDELGAILHAQFTKVKGDRHQVEERFLRSLRRYKGVYSPEEEANMPENKSTHHGRATRIKVKSATARLMDLVFPAGSDKNWDLGPTPVPDMAADPELIYGLAQQLQRVPTKDEIRIANAAKAATAARLMAQEIQDQLAEAKYRKLMKLVIQSGNLFGTGILKGPLVNRTYKKTWTLDPESGWVLQNEPKLAPSIDFVPIWEMYPETEATSFFEATYNYQRSVMPKHQVLGLAARPDFSSKKIKAYLKEHRDGDTTMLPWELELRRLGWNLTGNSVKSKRFEILERWGTLDAETLATVGLELPDDEQDEYWANVWLLGTSIIKMEVQPIMGMQMPYFAYYWDKDETSIFGEGIAGIVEADDSGLNASTRAMLDNAAVTAGPILEANVELLHPDENPNDVHPFKVFQRIGVGNEAQYPAIREIPLTSHTNEYLSLISHFSQNIDEATMPAYMHGENPQKGSIGRTSSGLGMLMSAAQTTFKDQLFSLDDDVQQPFIEAMYHWNMQFNPKEEIKGDFNVIVKGTSSLVAREIRAQNLDQFANSTLNQFDAPFIDRQALNVQRAKVLELGDDVVKSPEASILAMAQQLLREGMPDGQVQTAPNTAPNMPVGGNEPNPVNSPEQAFVGNDSIPSASPFPGATPQRGMGGG
jgi:hypothetical protein